MLMIAEKPYKVRLRGMGLNAPVCMTECDDLAVCQGEVEAYIRVHDIRPANWGPQCGEVFLEGSYIGRIGYDGWFHPVCTEKGKPLEEIC